MGTPSLRQLFSSTSSAIRPAAPSTTAGVGHSQSRSISSGRLRSRLASAWSNKASSRARFSAGVSSVRSRNSKSQALVKFRAVVRVEQNHVSEDGVAEINKTDEEQQDGAAHVGWSRDATRCTAIIGQRLNAAPDEEQGNQAG